MVLCLFFLSMFTFHEKDFQIITVYRFIRCERAVSLMQYKYKNQWEVVLDPSVSIGNKHHLYTLKSFPYLTRLSLSDEAPWRNQARTSDWRYEDKCPPILQGMWEMMHQTYLRNIRVWVWLSDSVLGLVFEQSLVKVQVKWFLRQEVEFLPLEVSRFLVPKIRLYLCIAY